MNPLDLRWQMVRDRWPVRVKNGDSAAIPPFSLVLITSSTNSSSTYNENLYTVVKPNNASSTDFPRQSLYLVTGPFAIGGTSGNEGLASSLVQPNFISTSSSASLGQVWGPKNGQFTAERYYFGYEILGGATTYNGVNIALARYKPTSTWLGKIDDSSVSDGSTCTVSIYTGSDGTTDTTMNATVRNRGTALTSLSSPYCEVFQNGEEYYLGYVHC